MSRARFTVIVLRDLEMFRSNPARSLFPLAFFLIACSLFPLGVGSEPNTLRHIAPGVVWVAALLSAISSLNSIYLADYRDGSLEQMCIGNGLPLDVVLAKALVHWLLHGAPLVLLAPCMGLLLGMQAESIRVMLLTLLLGTPVLSMLGGLGAAMTVGLRSSHMLQLLLVLPLCIPVLIFGAGAITAVDQGSSPEGHLSLLAATLILSLLGPPFAAAAALRFLP